jgi:hypothetical protein
MQASITDLEIPQHRKVQIKLEVAAECNITPFVARQKVNRFLLLSVGNLLMADDPSLDISPNALRWRVPVVYALPDRGILGKVGELFVDADNGQILMEESTPLEVLSANAERLYSEATP